MNMRNWLEAIIAAPSAQQSAQGITHMKQAGIAQVWLPPTIQEYNWGLDEIADFRALLDNALALYQGGNKVFGNAVLSGALALTPTASLILPAPTPAT